MIIYHYITIIQYIQNNILMNILIMYQLKIKNKILYNQN